MSGHPADEAFLDTLQFRVSSTRGHCDRCSHAEPTVVIGYVETGSGGGYDVRHCRGCVGLYLARARGGPGGSTFQPALPAW